MRVLVGGLTPRTYSVWRYDPSGAVELCLLDHPEGGPGATWGRSVRVGEQVRLRKPEGTSPSAPTPPTTSSSGRRAFGAMLDALREGARISGCVETDMIADQLPMHYGTDSTG
ncbi:siderophore-interacting protein [Streptomyces sp. NPDC050211]|uniref:siderophore-interacting protein n=1 Tax=Streptomyces sp. NPDC050211 TaxID=3154932 RepID=UPI0034229DA9